MEYLVLNPKTTSSYNDHICGLGLARIKRSKITSSGLILINPTFPIQPSNSAYHGITDEMVKGAPLLPEVWADLSPHFFSCIIVAHNAPFHLAVLGKALYHWDIFPSPVRYVDTLSWARKLYPKLWRYNLDYVCSSKGIFFTGDGAEKAEATGRLFLKMKRSRLFLPVQTWDFRRNLDYDTYIPDRNRRRR